MTEFLISVGVTIASWFASLFPEWEVPTWITHLDDTLNAFIAPFAGSGAWVPWALIFACVAVAIGAWVIGFALKAARALLSHVPFFGGAG